MMRHARWLTIGAALFLLALVTLPSRGASQGQSWTQFRTIDGLPSDSVWAIGASPDGRDVWLATSHGASLYRDGRWYSYSQEHGLGADWVASVAVDSRGRTWFGTFGGGLTVLDAQGSAWHTYTLGNSGLGSDWISALAVDAQGRLWCGTWGHGLTLLDTGQDGSLANWQSYSSANSPLPADYVTALALSPDGAIWIGLHGQGLARLANGDWTLFSTRTGLADDFVDAVAVGSDGHVWAGTGKGLNELDAAGQLLHTYTQAEGLPGDHVLSLAAGANGQLWVGTDRGAALLDSGRWTVYHAHSTLAHDYVSAIAVTPQGTWFGSLSAGASRFGTGTVASARRLPVVLVHGWHSTETDRVEDSEFRFLATWLHDDGYPVYYAEGVSPKNTLHQNAAQLRATIERAKRETGAAQVDIIAFSMGGLNTRAYVESSLYAGDVDQAFIMGTPQAGVRLWYPFLLREIHEWSRDPSAVELTPEYAALFNSLHADDWAVPYTLIAGDARGSSLPETLRGLPPGDALIEAGSALALDGPSIRKVLTDDLHAFSDQTILLGLNSYLWPRRTYDAYIRNSLRLGPGVAVPGLQEQKAPEVPLPETPVHSPFYSGETAAGRPVTQTVRVDTLGEARFYLRGESGPLTFSLIDPQGRRVDDKNIGERGEFFDLGMADVQAYLIHQAEPGPWQVVVGRPQDATGSVRFTGYAVLASPLKLAVSAAGGTREGEPVTITATLARDGLPVPRARVEAEIGRPDRQTDHLVLLDDGEHGDLLPQDGIYGGTYTPPRLGGYYTLFATAEGSAAGSQFARTAECLFAVNPGTGSLTGTYGEAAEDANHDGRYEALVLQVGVDIRAAGSYLVAATLADGQGRELSRVAEPLTLNAGQQTVALRFPGPVLAGAQADGPYHVLRVMLLDEQGAALPLQEARDVLTTRPYRYQDFGGSR